MKRNDCSDHGVHLMTVLERCRAQLYQARRELAAVDEALGEFYCPVRDPETDEEQGSFYLRPRRPSDAGRVGTARCQPITLAQSSRRW